MYRAAVLKPAQARHSGVRHRVGDPLKGHSPYHYGVMALTFLLCSFVFHVHLLDLLSRCEHHEPLFPELFISMEVTGPIASPFIQGHS